MHANLPVIANRWEKKYGLGGVAELNAELNSLPEYYLPKNQGGRIGFDSGSNGITLGSDKYNITLEPGASGSWTSHDLGHGYNVDDKNIAYGVDTTANIGPVEIGVDFKNFLDKFDVTKDGTTVEKDTEKDKQIAYSLGLNLKDLYAKIDSDEEFENWYFTIRKTFSGGGTPAHQAGIYGLAEGGRIGFNAGSMLVAPTTDGSRPGYAYDDVEDMGFGDGPDMGSNSTPDTSPDTSSDDPNPYATQFDMTPPTKDPTPDDSDARSKHKLAQSTQKKPYDPTGGEREWGDWVGGNVNQYGKIAPYEGYNISDRMELQAIEKAKQQRSSIGKTIGKGILTLASFGLFGPAAAKLASYYKTGEKIHSAYKTGKVNLKGIEVDINKVLDPVKARLNKEIDIDPSGLGYGKDLVDKPVINDTDNGQTNGQTNIQKEGQKIALKRKQEQEWASYLAQLRQEELNRKKDAYYKNYRQSYMSAKGGRVPGYNTGGLSNLFKLKTA